MSVHIRKLLSRKFNIVFLNLAGLLTCVLLITFPPILRAVVLKFLTSIPHSGHSLQLREQLQIFTGFPFNSITKHDRNLNSMRKYTLVLRNSKAKSLFFIDLVQHIYYADNKMQYNYPSNNIYG